MEDDECDVYVATIWKVWSVRNKILFRRPVGDVSKLSLRASNFVHAYKEANVQLRVQREELPGMWSLPPTRIYKVNFDEAKLGEWGHGWGMVIRDGEGDVVVVSVEQRSGFLGLEIEEARASIFAIKEAVKRGLCWDLSQIPLLVLETINYFLF